MQFSLTFQRVRTVMFSSRYTRSPFVMLFAVLLIVLTATHKEVDGTIPEEFISAGNKENKVTIQHCKNVRVISTLSGLPQLHQFRGFHDIYSPHNE